MKKLYTVTVESEIVVLADTPEKAEYDAERWAKEESFDVFAREMTHLSGGWELESVPYGSNTQDKTIKELIEDGCAPEYVKMKEKLKLIKTKLKATKIKTDEKD